MYIGKNDWAFKISGNSGDLEMRIPKKDEYSFDEMTVVAVSMMRFCEAVGVILSEFLQDEQNVKIYRSKIKG